MRAGVWCGAAALALLTLASALRTSQVENATRVNRRLPSPSTERLERSDQKEDVTTFRPRISRRREEILGRDQEKEQGRTRIRSRPTTEPAVESTQSERNERFEPRKTNTRTRSRPAEAELNKEVPNSRDDVIRSRSRQNSRRTTQSPEARNSRGEVTRSGSISTNFDHIPKVSYRITTPRADDSSTQQRWSSSSTSDGASIRRRGRINTRVDTKALDLSVSGTTNTLTAVKAPTTARTSSDSRNAKKLRYKPRLSETDSNLTVLGITATDPVIQSSQNQENITSQPEIITTTPATETTSQSTTEATQAKSPSIKSTKIVRRPLVRGKVNFRPSVSLPKIVKTSDEIGEDDNYPESFKALLQAKNASTHTSSPTSESLSVKASQKIYKTYTSSAQSTNTGSTKNKYTRFRSKINTEEESRKNETKKEGNEDLKITNTTVTPEEVKPKVTEYKPRGTYNPRSRKTSSSSTEALSSSNQSIERPVYKFNRKYKPSTTEAPKIESTSKFKRLGSNSLLKKPAVRPTYTRRNTTTEAPVVKDKKETNDSIQIKSVLPKTSYYSRLRNKKSEPTSTTTTEASANASDLIVETPADKKMEDTADMPLIFSLLKKSNDNETAKNADGTEVTKEPERQKKMFIIAVSSKESLERSTENEVMSKIEEEENRMPLDTVSTTQKYHSNFKVNNVENEYVRKDQVAHEATPPLRNIPTRKNGRKRTKPDYYEDVAEVTPKPRERNQRKYSEAFTKSTEPSTNGIPPEPEKLKGRFSSKYRASYLERPYYKPTVPTITPSTAWLKFFVTDPQLAKSVEEPNWFEGEDLYVTTEISRQSTTAPSNTHESSLELEEGEEIQLGPDMNAISFTKTRSTLSSADLRVSESLTKPSHTMNVEASQHSPSVTVSIFDALAEILTSTPRTPRLSSTTEVTQKQNINDLQTLGVSNSNTVNSVRSLASQDTFTTIVDVNFNTKSVQTTTQTPTVINRVSVGQATTPSLNTQDGNITPVNTPTLPTPPPTTPVSARRPFAIKVLYSDTEPPTDKSTATAPTRSSNQPSTDKTITVHNTVSDLLLSNNNLVSSELTSMLSNNIKNLIQNMDEKTKARISVDMAKLLKTLIPRALNGLSTGNDDVDIVPETTPYSMEEINDTGNINIDDKNNIDESSSLNPFQTVVTENVVNSIDTTLGITETPTQAVNSDNSPADIFSTLSLSSSQTTLADAIGTTASPTTINLLLTTTPSSSTTQSLSTAMSSDSIDTDSVIIESNGNRASDPSVDNTNSSLPLPFFTNFKIRDFTPADVDEVALSTSTMPLDAIPLATSTVIRSPTIDNINVQDPSQVSPMQLWVLSRKARVLQMIEDLIRQHNNEIATAVPLTEMLSQPNNIPLSNRLTQILNTMTTEYPDVTTEGMTTPMTTSTITPFPLLTTQSAQTGSTEDYENGRTSSTTEASINGMTATTIQTITDIFSRLSFTGLDETQTSTASTDAMGSTATTTATTSLGDSNQDFTTTVANTETTTDLTETEPTQTDTETTTIENIETTTEVNVENINTTSTNETNQNLISVVSNQINVGNQTPKKDYVIFGILPNNTVVRKDPNEDILETLTEASPYIVYSLLPNNTVIRRFPNGTRVPRVMQKIDVLPISPWSLRNPYSPIHNNPAIVRPHNPIRVSTNIVTSTDTSNNGTENRLTIDTVNNQQTMIPTTLNIKDSSSLGVTTATNKPPAEKSTASHVLSLRTSTMLPSVDEILLNSISSAVKEEMVISSMTSSTREPRILTLDIDPETKQIRTEKPGDGSTGTVFKYIPIDEVTSDPLDTNVLKLASTRGPSTQSTGTTDSVSTVTEIITQTPQIQTHLQTDDYTTTVQMTVGTPIEISSDVFTNIPISTDSSTSPTMATTPFTTWSTDVASTTTTTEAMTTTTIPTTLTSPSSTTVPQTTTFATTTLPFVTVTSVEENPNFQEDVKLLQSLFGTERSPKSLNTAGKNNQIPLNDLSTTGPPTSRVITSATQQSEEAKLLQALLTANSQTQSTLSIPNIGGNTKTTTGAQTSTSRSIDDDIRQFEEDTKLLKALLAATGQNPANLNIPSLDSLNLPTRVTSPLSTTTPRVTTTVPPPTTTTSTTTARPTTTTTRPTTTTARPITTTARPTTTVTPLTTTSRILTTTQTLNDDIKKLAEDAKLLQALLAATGQNQNNFNIPTITGVTSNVRIASNPRTTSVGSIPTTTPVNVRPVYTSRTTTSPPIFTTVPMSTTLQPQEISTTEVSGISSTLPPKGRRRLPTTTVATGRRAPASRFTVTTEIPSTSTFSDEEDLLFLQNLKSVLKNNPNEEDPESALANRIIALAVERSLNEIESGKQADAGRTGKTVPTTPVTRPPTTTTTTTTTPSTTTISNTPSIEDDIKQFQEDTKLLQALIKATGQDPSQFNIPTLPSVTVNTNVSPNLPSRANADLNLLSNLLASPSPLNEPFDSLTEKPTTVAQHQSTPARPFGTKIVVKDNLKNEKDDAELLKTLNKLQGIQETTTQKSKLAITGQSRDEALKKLIQQTKTPGMMSEATKAPVAISTEYGKSNDALLAALLKEQGFGPTTASSLDEQLRLAALLNQVVVTPKARRTTTPPPPPPPPAPRRPILDGLAWLWQQWRETGPGPAAPRPNRRPAPSSNPVQASAAPAPPRLNWFGSGPFVGNADDQPSSNRVPLEPPRVVVAEQAPGRGQLVSAAINVTRAFSQFLGAAIAGAAQTVQNVIRAGQRATAEAYTPGSG